jgi:hypothetical protein
MFALNGDYFSAGVHGKTDLPWQRQPINSEGNIHFFTAESHIPLLIRYLLPFMAT